MDNNNIGVVVVVHQRATMSESDRILLVARCCYFCLVFWKTFEYMLMLNFHSLICPFEYVDAATSVWVICCPPVKLWTEDRWAMHELHSGFEWFWISDEEVIYRTAFLHFDIWRAMYRARSLQQKPLVLAIFICVCFVFLCPCQLRRWLLTDYSCLQEIYWYLTYSLHRI